VLGFVGRVLPDGSKLVEIILGLEDAGQTVGIDKLGGTLGEELKILLGLVDVLGFRVMVGRELPDGSKLGLVVVGATVGIEMLGA